ncbi:hypothetical protein BKA57DRAFT_462753 [Linnemannia elongata]|nr:hypothetical protein BKA57DRAFT_462753 [Linnemannia elongata]
MLTSLTTWPTTTSSTWSSTTTAWTTPTTTTTWPTTTPTTTTTTTRETTTQPPRTTTQNPTTTTPPIRTTTPASGTTPFTSLIGSPPTSVIPTSTDLSVVPTSAKGDGTGGGIPKVAVIAIAVAGVLIIGFVSIVFVMKHQRHKRRQEELDPNELFGHFHNPPSPSPLTHITSGHHHNKHHQHINDDQYDHGGTHQHEMEQLYNNSEYHHQNHHGHHDGGHNGHHDGGHHGHHDGGHNGDHCYDHGGGHDSGGANQAQSHYDPSSGQGQAQTNTYNNPGSGGHQAIGNDGATGNQYAPNGGHGGGDFQGVGQGVNDTGNYGGGVDQGHHNLYDGYGGGHDTGYGHGGNDFGGYGQGQVDPSSGYGNGVSGGSSNIGTAGTGTGGMGGMGGASQPITSIPSGLQGGYAPYSIGAIPPPAPFIPSRPSNRVSVNPANTTAQQESYLLDLTSTPAPQGTSSTSYRPLDRFSSNASRSTHYSGGTGGGNSPVPPPVPIRPGSSAITHSTWDDSAQEFRPDRPLSQTSMASSTTAGPYHQSIGSPIMYQDFIPPPTTNKVPSPLIASILPATTSSSTAGVRRSVGAPQDRGPEMAAASGGQPSDLNAFERRAPQTQQENVQNTDSLFNVVASTLRQPQGGL